MRSIFTLTIFISSFLLFLVQPMLAKMLLPHIGGAPSVWTAAMLFFQLLLLAGYGYAALSSRLASPLVQSVLHIGLYLLVLVVYLPLGLSSNMDVNPTTSPEWWVMTTLMATIGLPYFLLSANSSILQRWYYALHNTEPYFLFSASNAGSFLGLFAYPFLVEWLWTLPDQIAYWAVGFIMVTLCFTSFPVILGQLQKRRPEVRDHRQLIGQISLRHAGKVIFLAFLPSSLFLSVTLYVTTDIASQPLIWIVPLALYLLTFIIVFARWGEPWIALAQKAHPPALIVFIIAGFFAQHTLGLVVHFALFFVVALSCHGQLARSRPTPEHLTAYFFLMSLGGVLGGLFNLAAPYLFNGVYEYYLVMFLSVLALPSDGSKSLFSTLSKQGKQKALVFSVVMIGLIAAVWLNPTQKEEEASTTEQLTQQRNFFGVSRVEQHAGSIRYVHGTTLHGMQPRDAQKRLMATTYYAPIMPLLKALPPAVFDSPFAAVGLGAGTVACTAQQGQRLDFFEINPLVIDIAQNPDYFTYLTDCPADITVHQGDGRIELGKMTDGQYSLLIMDAFSSDSVPFHLLTREAVQSYLPKMKADQFVIAFNISNRHLDLAPFLTRVADALGLHAYLQHFSAPKDDKLITPSIWLLMTPGADPWAQHLIKAGYEKQTTPADTPLWTDDYSNILPALK